MVCNSDRAREAADQPDARAFDTRILNQVVQFLSLPQL